MGNGTPKDVLFVIVLYKSALEKSMTYRTLLSKCNNGHIFVYDNSPDIQLICLSNIIYHHDPCNSGLSIAYNTAARCAKENGYEWLLLLDQDTDFSGVAIDDYKSAILANPNIKLFAPKVKCGERYMSPAKIHHKNAVLQSSAPNGIISLNEYSPINSGICVNVDAMIECGGYKEDVFLDYSDYQFIERFKRLYPQAYILDREAKQDFSAFSDSKEATLSRYRLFCRSIKACERHSFADNWGYLFVVTKRCISICFHYKTLLPLKTLWNSYL